MKTRKKEGNEDDEFNVSLAKMEEEIKTKIVSILESLNKNYSKLKKYQTEKLGAYLIQKNYQFLKIKILKNSRNFS